jgi:glucokinase
MEAPRLIADIGGTNARFALVAPDGHPFAEERIQVSDYPGPVEAVRSFLAGRRVDDAVLAVATPVDNDWIALTNSPWAFSIAAAQEALGLTHLAVINDFTAQALAVPRLGSEDRVQIGNGASAAGQPLAVIGAGTGLGVAGLVPTAADADAWQPIASEGGHVSLAPHDEVDGRILAVLRRRFGHVSNERALSGPGLVNLASALAEIDGRLIEVADPAEVSRRALAGDCPYCREATARFSAWLGAAAGDLALTFCARGGVYVGGGLALRMGRLFDHQRFRAAFVAKGRFEAYLRAIPTYLVTCAEPGLLGAAAFRFAP